jgi:Co/Zn/Cd efflux system component
MEPNSELLGQIRVVLAGFAGALVAKGWIGSSLVEPIVGLAMALLVALWSWYSKKKAREVENEKIAVALKLPSTADHSDVERVFNSNKR